MEDRRFVVGPIVKLRWGIPVNIIQVDSDSLKSCVCVETQGTDTFWVK